LKTLKSINYQKSLEYFEKELKIRKDVLPEKHSKIAHSLYNLGWTYRILGENKISIENWERALEIRRNVLPEKHLDIADSLYNLGASYGDLGDHQKSIEYWERVFGESVRDSKKFPY